MGLILKQKITGPAAWTGQDLSGDTSWIHPLSTDAIASIDAALAAVKTKGLKFPHFGKADFPLDAQALKLQLNRRAASRAFWTAGSRRPIRIEMIAMTTSSSMSVNAFIRCELDILSASC